jgi:hypothetical protein
MIEPQLRSAAEIEHFGDRLGNRIGDPNRSPFRAALGAG